MKLVHVLVALLATSSPLAAAVDGLSECASGCVTQASTERGCKGETDIACVCSSEFRSIAASCLMSKCTSQDLQDALALSTKRCSGGAPSPSAPAPTSDTPAPTSDTPAPTSDTPAPTSDTPAPTSNTPAPTSEGPAPSSDTPAPTASATPSSSSGVDGLSACASGCVTQAATERGCKGESDIACVCSDEFRSVAASCLMSKCTSQDLQDALALSTKRCSGGASSATPSDSSSAPCTTSDAPSTNSPVSSPTASNAPHTSHSPHPTGEGCKPTTVTKTKTRWTTQFRERTVFRTKTTTKVITKTKTQVVTVPGAGSATGCASPTGTGPTSPSSTSGGNPLEGLSACASQCIIETVTKQGCKGADDTACLCTSAFQSAAGSCLMSKCTSKDLNDALALSKSRCSGGSPSGTGGAPSPTASETGAPGPSSTSGGNPLEGLSACASQCIIETVTSQGCKGADDTACLCTSAFQSAAGSCLMSKCTSKDLNDALALSKSRCSGGSPSATGGSPSGTGGSPSPTASQTDAPGPSSTSGGGNPLEGLSACASQCIIETVTSQGCKGADDTACLCTSAFQTAAGSCLMSKCTSQDLNDALALSKSRCSGGSPSGTGGSSPSATGGSPSGTGGSPSPTASQTGAPGPSSTSGGGNPLEGLSACASQCIIETVTSQGCKGADDTACLCTSAFQTAAGSCLMSKCTSQDLNDALALSKSRCSGSPSGTGGSPSPTGGSPSATGGSPSGTGGSPSPTVSQTDAPGPSSTSGGGNPLEGLSACASKCILEAITKQGCKGADDTACLCTSEFKSVAASCLMSGCSSDDLNAALALSNSRCSGGSASSTGGGSPSVTGSPTSSGPSTPSSTSGGNPLEGLSPCASNCIMEAITKQGCKGETDTACLCTDAFKSVAASCLMNGCTSADVQAALALSNSRCSGGSASPTGGSPSATGGSPSGTGGSPSVTGSPTASGPSTPSSSSGGNPLEGLSQCASKCIMQAITKQGCKGETDTACLCTAEFKSVAASCLMSGCTSDDLQAALALSNSRCSGSGASTAPTPTGPSATPTEAPTSSAPSSPSASPTSGGGTPIEGLSKCASDCILQAISKQGCKGETDTACLCTDAFRSVAATCLMGGCTSEDLQAALALSNSRCSGSGASTAPTGGPTATGGPTGGPIGGSTSAPPTPTSSSGPSTETPIEGLSQCASNCIRQAITKQGCKGETDTACLCTDAFRSVAASCLLGGCTSDDLNAALALSTKRCSATGASSAGPSPTASTAPPSGSSNVPTPTSSSGSSTETPIEGLSACASKCIREAITKQGCKGETDLTCICSAEFKGVAASCLMGGCTSADVQAALALSNSRCSGGSPSAEPTTPSATPTSGPTSSTSKGPAPTSSAPGSTETPIEGLSECASKCIRQAIATQHCTGETDTACLCTDAFRSVAATCLMGGCSSDDLTAALALSTKRCSGGSSASPTAAPTTSAPTASATPSSTPPVTPTSEGPSPTESAPPSTSSPIEGLSQCASDCIYEAVAKQGCKGDTDTACLCTSSFQAVAGSCLMSKCTSADLQAALALSNKRCSAPSSASTPAPTSTAPAPTSDLPASESNSPTTTAPPTTSSGVIEGLSQCASDCIYEAVAKQGCKGDTDTACLCTNDFKGVAASCLMSKCTSADVSAALALSNQRCSAQPTASAPTSSGPAPTSAAPTPTSSTGPSTPSGPIEGLSQCASDCIYEAVSKQGCKGDTDTACLCTSAFQSVAGSCLMSKCPSADLQAALALSTKRCSGGATSAGPTPTATSPGTPTSSSGPAPTTSAAPMPDLSKLSSCALQCILGQISSNKCAGPTDTSCICTAAFTNGASQCIMNNCPITDAIPALDLSRNMCPDLGLPDMSSMSSCGQECVLTSMKQAECAGPVDRPCICGVKFTAKSGICTLKCGLSTVGKALELQRGQCKQSGSGGCNAEGIYKILEPKCWGKRDLDGLDMSYAPRDAREVWEMARRDPAYAAEVGIELPRRRGPVDARLARVARAF